MCLRTFLTILAQNMVKNIFSTLMTSSYLDLCSQNSFSCLLLLPLFYTASNVDHHCGDIFTLKKNIFSTVRIRHYLILRLDNKIKIKNLTNLADIFMIFLI